MKRKAVKTVIGMLLLGVLGTGLPFAALSASPTQTTDGNPIVFTAVARDADGFVRHDKTLNLNVHLVDRTTNAVLYSERHTLTTDAMGQVQIPLGSGTLSSGELATVDFSQSIDLVVYDGNTELMRSPLTQVPSAAYADKAEHASTAQTALSAMSAERAQTAQLAKEAEMVRGLNFNDEGEPATTTIWSSEKVSRMIINSGNTSGQTGLAKEEAARKAEDSRLWDSLAVLNNRTAQEGQSALAKEIAERKAEDSRLGALITDEETARKTEDQKLLDSLRKEAYTRELDDDRLRGDIASEANERTTSDAALREALTTETNARTAADEALQDALTTEGRLRKTEDINLKVDITNETTARTKGDSNLMDSITTYFNRVSSGGQTDLAKERKERIDADANLGSAIAELNEGLGELTANLADTSKVLRDAIASVKENLTGRLDSINHCMVNDAEKGIYTAAIPLYSAAKPLEVGLFTEPLLKVLRQSQSCDLITALNQASELKKSYRCRVMTYNTSGDASAPTEVYIPASTTDLDIYVDNVKIDETVTYYTYDVLVFDVEFYYLGDGVTPKLYVTLIRE